jgi:putative hydrolase of the HAD superfamily
MILLFDAANTIIHKPTIYLRFAEVLKRDGFTVDLNHLMLIHKTISECFHFPDNTSKDFYYEFNKSVLYGLGIIAREEILENLFKECSYLPWEKFEDTKFIKEIPFKKAVLSNFHKGLNEILKKSFSDEFTHIITSENENLRKPDTAFFKKAIDVLGVKPSEIIYIGDSVKLDLEPGLKTGMNAWLIDRNNYYPLCNRRLSSLQEIRNIL